MYLLIYIHFFKKYSVICYKIENVNEFRCLELQNTERDFKSEYLIRTCSIAANLVTSLEFNPIRCATTPSHFGQTGNDSVATHFILLNNTAMSSATGGYVAVPERLK